MEILKRTDIYLLDQIFKGTFKSSDKILDAGCGSGRNMTWFAKNGFAVFGCDLNSEVLKKAEKYTGLSTKNFEIAAVENLPYNSAEFDAVISNAVLHFANSEKHFTQMINQMHRVLKPNGILFIRMTSTFGLPKNYSRLKNGRYLLKDNTERFLLNANLLEEYVKKIFVVIEPVKSVLVEELRSMTTLVLRKK